METIDWVIVGKCALWTFLLGLISLVAVAIYLLVYKLADKSKFWTFVPGGQSKVVLTGKTPIEYLANVPGYDCDRRTGVFTLVPATATTTATVAVPTTKWRRAWLKFWGKSKPHTKNGRQKKAMFWIGIPPYRQILKYPLRWTKSGKTDQSNVVSLISKSEIVDSDVHTYPYGIQVGDEKRPVKLVGNEQVIIELVVTTETINLETKLVKLSPAGNWINLFSAKIDEAVRTWCQKKTVKQLREAKEATASTVTAPATDDDLSGYVLKLSDIIQDLCGVAIRAVEFTNWGWADPDMEKAFTAKTKAKEFGEAEVVKAELEAKAARARAEGERDATNTVTTALAERVTEVGNRKVRVLRSLGSIPGAVRAYTDVAVAESVAGSSVTVWAQGGANTQVGVIAETAKDKPVADSDDKTETGEAKPETTDEKPTTKKGKRKPKKGEEKT